VVLVEVDAELEQEGNNYTPRIYKKFHACTTTKQFYKGPEALEEMVVLELLVRVALVDQVASVVVLELEEKVGQVETEELEQRLQDLLEPMAEWVE